jgi:diaminohydroxyphosphoribosylaminopyrimidine deaminase/5-amino-6-(5-phosphoribosylamino)uracil reductase
MTSLAADADFDFLRRAATISQESIGLTFPHPNHGAALVSASGHIIATAFQRAQGTPSVEEQILRESGDAAAGSTLYLNLETGDCHGDTTAIECLLQSGVQRIVIGMRYPLKHLRGASLSILQAKSIQVQLLESHPDVHLPGTAAHAALRECLDANEVRSRPTSYICP